MNEFAITNIDSDMRNSITSSILEEYQPTGDRDDILEQVRMRVNRLPQTATVVGYNISSDLAVIKIDAKKIVNNSFF